MENESSSIVSIITITFNNFEELLETLESVRGIQSTEKIVINGGSCDRTKKFLIDNQYIHISEPDFGIADAFNKGIHLSSGQFVFFLNSGDVLLDKDYIKKSLEIFQSNPQIMYVHSGIISEDFNVGKRKIFAREENYALRVPFFHPTLITRKKVFDEIGLFDTSFRIAMDYDHALRMMRKGYIGHVFSHAITTYMKGGGISSSRERQALSESWRCLRNNKYSGPRVVAGIFGRMIRLITKKIIGPRGRKILYAPLKKIGMLK